MESINEAPKVNKYIEKINEIKEGVEGESVFPLGKIDQVSYSNSGEVLSLKISGDVPTNFSNAEIVIVHPNAEKDGWIGKGKIGFLLGGKGVLIDKIPLPWETLHKIEKIYLDFCNKEYREGFYPENNINRFTELGFIKEIVDKTDT